MVKKIKYKRLWFFGLSGTGKTYLSKKISKKLIQLLTLKILFLL